MRRGWLLFLAACGRVGFDGRPDAGAFSDPVVVPELASAAAEDDPSLTADMLEIYFNSDRAGGLGASDIWMASRSAPDQPFGVPVNVGDLNSVDEETTPEIVSDGLTIFLSSDRPGGVGGMDIYVATRPSRGAAWSVPAHIPSLCSTAGDESPMVSADRLTMFFDSERVANPYDTIFFASRPTDSAPWSAPVLRDDLDGPGEEENPFLSADGRALYMSQDLGAGADVYVATRPDADTTFAAAVRVDVSSSAFDLDPWVSDDGRTIYFSSDRTGNFEILVATR